MNLKDLFERDGFVVLRDVIPESNLNEFESHIRAVALSFLDNGSMIYETLSELEDKQPENFQALCNGVGGSFAGMSLVTNYLIRNRLNEITQNTLLALYPTPPTLLFNKPSKESWPLLSHLSTKESFHLWFPLFKNLTSEDGPLVLHRTSHKFEAEEKAEEYDCTLNRGDAVLVSSNLIYFKARNKTITPSILASFNLKRDHEQDN